MADIILDIGGNTSRLDRDIQKTVNRVYSINLKTKGEQPLGRITGKVNEFEKSLAASNARVIAFGASASIIYGVGAAFRSLAESVVSVQKSLQDINVILNVSNAELNKFGADLFNIAKNTGQSFDEVAKAATEFSRQGLGVAETLKRTNEALILSRLSGLDAAKSVEALTAAVNSFASQSVTATEIVNKFATVDAAFAVSSADLAEAIARVGSSAAQSGVSLNELIAIVTSAQQTTARGGAVIGNSFKTIFTRLQREKVVDLLGSLGISSTDSQGQLKSTIELLTDLGKVYDTLGSQQQAYVAEQVGGVFQINILKAALADLGKEYSIYNNALQVANSATDQAVRRNEELNKTFASQLNALQQNTKQLSSTVGERLLGPLFDRTVGNLNELLGGINESDANSFGATLGKGILDGIGQIIAGPGLILFGGVILKLLRDFSTYASSSAKDLLGLNNASKQQKEIQQSINQIISKNPDLYSLMQQGAVGLNQASEKLLNNLRAQTLELQEQKVLTAQVARALYSSGVRVTEGVPMVQTPKGTKARSGGFIPNFAIQSELSGIKKSPDYNSNQKRKAAGDIRTGRIPGLGPTVFNGQETFAKSTEVAQALGYPKGTKPKNPAQKYSILTPRMSEDLGFAARGFVPNFAEDKNISKYQKGFAAGKVFDNAIALSLGLKKAYVEDRDVIDFAPNLLAPPKIDNKVKNLMGIDSRTLYGDAKLSDSDGNRASFISKILRLPGTQIRNNTVIPASRGGSILIPGSVGKNSPDRPQNLRAGVGAILKKNPSVARTPVFQNSGLEKGDSLFLPNVLIDSVKNITRQTVFGNVAGRGKNFQDFNVRKSAAENIASRFGFKKPKTFSSGFIPNFAQTATQSNKVVELGDTTTNPLFRGKISSLIYPQVSEDKSKAPAETTYLGKKYKGLVSIAGINKKALKGELPDLEKNLDQLLLREANEFGRAIGGTEFLQSASELPNIGAAKGAVGVSFEGGLLTLLKRDVQKSAQNARIDFTQDRINTKFKSLFHGAPGTYEAKYSPSLTGEVLQKMLRGAGVGEVKRVKSGPGAGASLKQREAVLASIDKDVAEGKITQPRRGNALEAEIRRRLPLMFPGSVKGAAAGFIPNFAAPLVRAVDDKELRMMLSKFGKGWSFQNRSFDQSAMEYFGGSGTYMWDALSRPGEQMSDRQAYKQNIGRAKNWASARKQSSWLVRYNRSKLKDSELLPDMETGGASVYGLPLSKNQIVWPIKQSNGAGRIFEKDIPAFLNGQLNNAIKREREAGIPKSKIYLAQEKALTSANPMGLGVFNKLQEPNKATRKAAMKNKGFASGGFIPNFAETTIGVAADTQAEDLGNTIASVVTQMSFFGFALQGSGDAYRSELERQKEVLKKNYETQNKLLQSAGKTSPKFLALSQAALKAEQRLKNLDKPYAASQAKVSAGLRSSAFPILTIAPILAETIANGIGKETKEQRVASAATSGAGTIASFAATGALIGGGIPGAVVGATVGGLITLVDVLKEASTDIPEFSKAAKEASEKLTKLNDTSQSASQLFQSFQEQRSQGQDVDAQKTLKQLETLIRSQFKDTPEIATEALQAVRDNNFADFTSVLQRNISGAAQEDANKSLELILKKANEQFQRIDNLYNTDLGFFEQRGNSGPLVGKELEIVKGRTQDILSGSKLSSLELPELQTLRKRILELGFNFDKIGDIKELENLLKSIGYTDKQIALLTEGVDPKILKVVWYDLAEAITNQASIVNNAALDSVKADPINAKIISELEKIYKNYSLISQLTKSSAELQIKLNAQTRKNQQAYQAAVFEGDIGLAEILGAKEEGRGLGIQKEITGIENEARAPVFEGIDQLKTQIQELLNIRLNQQMARVETGAFTQNLTKGPEETDRDFNRRKTLTAADETRRILEVSGSQETLINTMEDILNTPGVRDENGGFNIKFFEDTLKARLPGVEGDAAQQEILDKIRATLIDIDVNTALAERQIKEQTRVILRQDLNRVMKELAQATISSFGGFEAFLTSDKGDKTLGDKFSDIATERANLVDSINRTNEPITEDARQALGRASGQTLNVLEDIIGGPLGLEIGGPNSLRGQEVAGRASQIEEIINEVRRTPGIEQDPALQQGIRATEEKFFQRAGLTEEYQKIQKDFAGDEEGLNQAITDLIKQASQNIAEIQSNAFRETGNIGSSFYEEALQTFSPEQQELLKQAGGQIEDPGTAAIILQNDEMIKQGGEQIGLLQDLLNNLSEAIPATVPTTSPNTGGDVNSSNSLQVSAPVTVTINTNSEGVREARARGLSEEEIQKLLQPKIEAAVQEVAAQINASFGSTREAVNNILNDPKNASYRPAPQTRRAETSDYVIR